MRPKTLEGEKVTVIVPVWNEGKFIGNVLRPLIEWQKEDPKSREILVVDDGSTDKTARIAKKMNVKVIPSDPEGGKHLGKGQAFFAGARVARDKKSTILVSFDADVLDLTPKKLTGLVAELKTKKLNMLIATALERSALKRQISGFVVPELSPFSN
ncbi:glycosyltransferase, partial [Candidatus Micrarchaeota archaeon]|nr:glycosyltransferase [Candidatus Micrarchaeota archaeon]